MKLKKAISMFLALALILCGCATNRPVETIGPENGTESQPYGKSEAILPTAPLGGEEKQVFITCQNYNLDVCTYYSWQPGPTFYILSRDPVPVEDITVSVPVKSKYQVNVYEDEGFDRITNYEIVKGDSSKFPLAVDETNLDFYLYLYQTYRGMDWDALGTLYTNWSELSEQCEALYDAGEEPDEQLKMAAADAGREYHAMQMLYVEDYQKLTAADLPELYVYYVEVYFSDQDSVEETFQSMEVHLGKDVYGVDVGEIRIHPGRAASDIEGNCALGLVSGSAMEVKTYPYGPGIEEFYAFTLSAEEDVTLTGFSILEGTQSTAEVIKIYVHLADTIDTTDGAMEILWDGKTPIFVPAGKYVMVDLLIHDERMAEICYGGNLCPVVEYEHNGNTYTCISPVELSRHNYEPWLWYAIGLDGLDLKSYFHNYYYEVLNTWRKEYA